jgi:hypothetical protein
MLPFSARDVVDFLAWWRRQGREVREFARPKVDESQLHPWIERVEYSRTVTASAEGAIVVVVRNLGADAWVAGITVSFPNVPKDGDNAYVTLRAAQVSDHREPEVIFAKNHGEEVWRLGKPVPAECLVHEMQLREWKHGQRMRLGLRVLALNPGPLPFLVRAWACGREWAECEYFPERHSSIDQQGYPAYPLAIEVRPS